MLALRLTRAAHPAVQLRRLLVAAASAGTGFLLLCALGYALGHPGSPGAAALRLAWCAAPLAATLYFALAVARTDPGTKPRTGLSAIGLGPLRLMAVSATTTALSCTLGSMLALLVFLHLRGDLTGLPFDGAAAEALAADQPLPLPGALTLLALVPAGASISVVLTLRPREQRAAAAARVVYGRFGAYRRTSTLDTFGAYGRFGRQITRPGGAGAGEPAGQQSGPPQARTGEPAPAATVADAGSAVSTIEDPARPSARPAAAPDTADAPAASEAVPPDAVTADAALTAAPSGLPWGITVLAAGLAVETYASRSAPAAPDLTFSGASPGVMAGWTLATVGLALAGPGLTHLCGRLLQSARPGALRLLAGRILMTEATRIGRPLGVVCAVLSATYAMALLHAPNGLSLGPLTLLGVLLVTGCTVATLLTAAVEARQARADTTSALLRLGAPATMLRSAAALRAGALLALFAPLTLTVAELAALPLAR
ncbi:hypothetical protein [Streptomyces purpurascens]|uniref:Integral membrane protein n=1 Tax=Streptomyces purpurascens TaxID=1924 RepID=A0ABZ1MSR4_STREF|nr:hypothetical protein [Streptomyces purpurascens]MCE7049256.1 hypothetical protein [Streptomyces purpurascens]GHA47476.1 hypothetical protein GCM10010303_68520 [Streptomyces purpurascens]